MMQLSTQARLLPQGRCSLSGRAVLCLDRPFCIHLPEGL